jgi:hypothetical protein
LVELNLNYVRLYFNALITTFVELADKIAAAIVTSIAAMSDFSPEHFARLGSLL